VALHIGGVRPSDLLGYEGTDIEKLLLDATILNEVLPEGGGEGMSVRDEINRRRAEMFRRARLKYVS